MLNDINPLRPSYIYKIWGGEKLLKKKVIDEQSCANNYPLGETWEVSIHDDGPSFLNDGTPLKNFLNKEALPYLVKFIDTCDYLSVQVHPDDSYAKKFENSVGKTECWIILDAQPGEGIYLGFKENVRPEIFRDAVLKGEDLREFLQFHEVKKGDFFYVPAGSVHAIGKGVTLVEIQQSSGITYRVWDWNRVEKNGRPRELHIAKAMDVLNFKKEHNTSEYFRINHAVMNEAGMKELIAHRDFCVQVVNLNSNDQKHQLHQKRACSVICLEGKVIIKTKKQMKALRSYESAIINLDVSELEISSDGRGSYVFVS